MWLFLERQVCILLFISYLGRIRTMSTAINSSRSSISCCLFGAKPLPALMLIYCQMDRLEHTTLMLSLSQHHIGYKAISIATETLMLIRRHFKTMFVCYNFYLCHSIYQSERRICFVEIPQRCHVTWGEILKSWRGFLLCILGIPLVLFHTLLTHVVLWFQWCIMICIYSVCKCMYSVMKAVESRDFENVSLC